MTWAEEVQAVDAAAARYNVDPLFILAIRIAEGRHSRYPFGIVRDPAPSYAEALASCCATVRNHLCAPGSSPLVSAHCALGVRRVAYSDTWITTFGRLYCPVGAADDPRGLNDNWVRNVTAIYDQLLALGVDDPIWSERWDNES